MLALWLVDPIEWYMRKGDREAPAPPREVPRRAYSYGPSGEASPPPPPREDLRERRRAEHERWAREHHARRESLLREFGPLFEAKTRELLDGRAITISTTGGTVWARLVRFRNGAVLETNQVSPTGRGHGKARIEKQQLTDPVPVVATDLTNAILNLGLDVRPLT
jgi:hypothetical protein